MDEREDMDTRINNYLDHMYQVIQSMDMTEATEFEYVADEDESDIEKGDADERMVR